MEMKMNFYKFTDYRDLIASCIQERKAKGKVFTYRWFSQKAGLGSPNFLNLVVQKKRHLSSKSAEKTIEIFGFNQTQADFFRKLVQYNKAKTNSEKEQFAYALLQHKKLQEQKPLSKKQFEYYAKWYHIPIREILTLNAVEKSTEKIHKLLRPNVSYQAVEKALLDMNELGLIHTHEKEWRVDVENLTTGDEGEFESHGVAQYHREMMKLAGNSIDDVARNEREISSVTVGLSQNSFEKIKQLIVEMRSKIMAIAEDDCEKSIVYQFNFQIFPLTKKLALIGILFFAFSGCLENKTGTNTGNPVSNEPQNSDTNSNPSEFIGINPNLIASEITKSLCSKAIGCMTELSSENSPTQESSCQNQVFLASHFTKLTGLNEMIYPTFYSAAQGELKKELIGNSDALNTCKKEINEKFCQLLEPQLHQLTQGKFENINLLLEDTPACLALYKH